MPTRATLMFVALVVCSSGCAYGASASSGMGRDFEEKQMNQIRSRAPHEFDCPADEIEYEVLNAQERFHRRTIGVDACGAQGTYVCRGIDCYLNSASGDQAPTKTSAPGSESNQ